MSDFPKDCRCRLPCAWMFREALRDAAVIDMIERNRYSTDLTASMFADSSVILVDSAVAKRLAPLPGTPGEFHQAVRRIYPKVRGHLMLTLPGFSPDSGVAFVYAQFSCGRLCAWDEGFTLERGLRGEWKKVARRRYSVS